MGYVTREMIDQAKEMDLLTYLQTYEPQELVHFGGSTYCTREHDSLKISNGKWCWFSRGIGGRTALDYLIKVKEVPFTEAVERIVGRAAERPPISNAHQQPEQTKALLLMRRASPGRANAGMNGRAKSVWYALGLLPAVWLGLLVAPAASGGLFEIIRQFPAAMQHPLHIIWCEDSGKAVLFFAAAYGLLVGVVLSTRRNYRRGVEHGSAKWGSPERLNRKYCAKPPEPNKVFTQHIRMGLDGRKHRRNLNTVVVGGSGAGKTRCYAKPCLYEACLSPKGPSFVCLDPNGKEVLGHGGGLRRRRQSRGGQIRVYSVPL